MNIYLLMEECVSVGDVLGLHRLDQKQGSVNFIERTWVTTVVLFSFVPEPLAASTTWHFPHRLLLTSLPRMIQGRYS